MYNTILTILKIAFFSIVCGMALSAIAAIVSTFKRKPTSQAPPRAAAQSSPIKVPARWNLEDPNDLEATIATLEEERSRLIDYAQALELEAERLKIKKPLKSSQLLVKAAGLDKKIVQIEIAISNYKKFN